MYYTQQYDKNYDISCLFTIVIIYTENLLSTNNVSNFLLAKSTTKQWQYQVQHQTVLVNKLCSKQKINPWSSANESHSSFCKCCNNLQPIVYIVFCLVQKQLQILLMDTCQYMVHWMFCCRLHSWTDYLEGSICTDCMSRAVTCPEAISQSQGVTKQVKTWPSDIVGLVIRKFY